jgi:hypothetical protein
MPYYVYGQTTDGIETVLTGPTANTVAGSSECCCFNCSDLPGTLMVMVSGFSGMCDGTGVDWSDISSINTSYTVTTSGDFAGELTPDPSWTNGFYANDDCSGDSTSADETMDEAFVYCQIGGECSVAGAPVSQGFCVSLIKSGAGAWGGTGPLENGVTIELSPGPLNSEAVTGGTVTISW